MSSYFFGDFVAIAFVPLTSLRVNAGSAFLFYEKNAAERSDFFHAVLFLHVWIIGWVLPNHDCACLIYSTKDRQEKERYRKALVSGLRLA